MWGSECRGQDAGAEHRYRTRRAEPETVDGAPGGAVVPRERVRAESFGTLSSGRSERVDGQLNAVAGDAGDTRLRRAPSPVWEAFPAGPSPGTLWPDPPASHLGRAQPNLSGPPCASLAALHTFSTGCFALPFPHHLDLPVQMPCLLT